MGAVGCVAPPQKPNLRQDIGAKTGMNGRGVRQNADPGSGRGHRSEEIRGMEEEGWDGGGMDVGRDVWMDVWMYGCIYIYASKTSLCIHVCMHMRPCLFCTDLCSLSVLALTCAVHPNSLQFTPERLDEARGRELDG